jgi:lipid A 4'-phosphatase
MHPPAPQRSFLRHLVVGSSAPAQAAVRWLLAVGALIGITFAVRPDLDIALTRTFFEPATKHFPLTFNTNLAWLRDQAPLIVFASFACIIVSLLAKLVWPSRPMLIRGRAVIFLITTFALGPGLLVNVILKEHWSRPRPAEIIEFGGEKQFVAWWDPRGTCDQNCSFVSGETSMAAWTLAPAVLVPGPLGAAAVAGALLVTLGMAVMRFIVGGHFFTDIAFAVLFTWLIIWGVHGLVYRWPRTALREQDLENALERLGRFVQTEVPSGLRRRAKLAVAALRTSLAAMRAMWRQGNEPPKERKSL